MEPKQGISWGRGAAWLGGAAVFASLPLWTVDSATLISAMLLNTLYYMSQYDLPWLVLGALLVAGVAGRAFDGLEPAWQYLIRHPRAVFGWSAVAFVLSVCSSIAVI